MGSNLNFRVLFEESKKVYDDETNKLSHYAKDASKGLFTGGARWMKEAFQCLRKDDMEFAKSNYELLGLFKQDEMMSKIPIDLDSLMKIKGVGRKTATITRVFGFGKADCIPVDVHVFVIANRLGWVKEKTPEKTELELMKIIPKKYWFETQYEPHAEVSIRARNAKLNQTTHAGANKSAVNVQLGEETRGNRFIPEQGRNKRCVWKINTKPFKEAHFAVYPEELCETPIKAGCPKFICKKCDKPISLILSSSFPKSEPFPD